MFRAVKNLTLSCVAVTSLIALLSHIISPKILTPIQAAYSWTQANTNGFGKSGPFGSQDFFDMIVYNNCLYSGIEGKNDTEGALIYRSCDGTNWTQVNTNGFGDPVNNDHVDSMIAWNGYLYVSTGMRNSAFSGTQIWRSADGITNWTKVNTNGFGSNHNENAKSFTVFNGWLCSGTWNANVGAALWCTQDGTTWLQKSPNGMGNVNNYIMWWIQDFNGYLYVSIENDIQGGEVWRTNDLQNWTQVISAGGGYGTNSRIIPGFGVLNNEIYIILRNGTSNPIEIRKSSDGLNFSTAYSFPDLTLSRPPTMKVFQGYFYLPFRNTTTGTQLWRSKDGSNWEMLNGNGFGSTTNDYGFLAMFGDYLYEGVGNYTLGQQVWRLPAKQQIYQLNPNLNVYDVTAATEYNIESGSQYGTFGNSQKINVKTSSDILLGEINVDMNSNRNWPNVIGQVDMNYGKSYLNGLQSAAGISGTYSLYTVIPNGITPTGAIICPNVTSISEVTPTCFGGVTIANGETKSVGSDTVTANLVTKNSINYWKLSGFSVNAGAINNYNDSILPTGNIVINNNNTYATSANINLSISATDNLNITSTNLSVKEMMISNTNDFASALWQPYATTSSWSLSSGEGNKSVYIKFRDISYNESITYSDSIILDSTPPNPFVTIVDGHNVNSSETSVEINTTKPTVSGTSESGSSINFNINSQNYSTTADINGNYSFQITSALTEGNNNLSYYSVDLAGNTSGTKNFNLAYFAITMPSPTPTVTSTITPTPKKAVIVKAQPTLTVTPTMALEISTTPEATPISTPIPMSTIAPSKSPNISESFEKVTIKVLDQNDNYLPNVDVLISEINFKGKTDSNGVFELKSIKPGTYKVIVTQNDRKFETNFTINASDPVQYIKVNTGNKGLVSEIGKFGIASIALATLGLLFIIFNFLTLLIQMILSGLLIPFLALLFKKGKSGKVQDDFLYQGIPFVVISVYSLTNNQLIKKALTNLNGKYYLDLEPGKYKLEFSKSNYEPYSIEIDNLTRGRIEKSVIMKKSEDKDIARQFQFKVFNISPMIWILYLASALAFINMGLNRNFVALLTFIFICSLTLLFHQVKNKIKYK
jgi:hypothetical protein